jgi:hypothetical protein
MACEAERLTTRGMTRTLTQEGGRHHTRRHARLLEYLHDWIGESGYDYDPRLLLRSPLLAGWVDRRAKRGGATIGPPFVFDSGKG